MELLERGVRSNLMSSSATTYTEFINSFFTNKYKHLSSVATNILWTLRKPDLLEFREDLLTECYSYIATHRDKLYNLIILSGGIESVAINWMDKQIKWSDTFFKKSFLYPKNETYKQFNYETQKMEKKEYEFKSIIFEYVEMDQISSKDFFFEAHLPSEEERDEEFFLQEMMDHQNKETRYAILWANMSTERKCLFDIVYKKGHNTTDKLHKYLKGVSRTSCYYMLKDLKNYIKENI